MRRPKTGRKRKSNKETRCLGDPERDVPDEDPTGTVKFIVVPLVDRRITTNLQSDSVLPTQGKSIVETEGTKGRAFLARIVPGPHRDVEIKVVDLRNGQLVTGGTNVFFLGQWPVLLPGLGRGGGPGFFFLHLNNALETSP